MLWGSARRAPAAALGFALVARAIAAPSPTLDPAQVQQVSAVVRAAPAQGLGGETFPVDPAAAAVAYARAQHGERLPAAAFPRDWAIRPESYDPAGDFARALGEGRLAPWLAAQSPPDGRYARLLVAYARYQAIAARGGWLVLPRVKRLGPGDTGVAVQALRDRLAIEDPLVGALAKGQDPAAYDAALVAAVRRAQARYGVEADGKAGPATLAALNIPVEGRLVQIRANLERWRWVTRVLPARRVELNTADATLELRDPGSQGMAMRAIVGRAAKPTPMFADNIRAVVFNPPWNVPEDIARKEIWPNIRRDRGYMARQGFVVRTGGGLQQLPGPKCALGAVKFDLSNSFGVYLHDTPAHSLFALDRRALSHGCMRLENPLELAKRLLAGDPAWPETTINLTLLSAKTTRAPLRTPVPVFVFYWTAFVDDAGQTQFRRDVYGWDAKLARLLRASGHSL